MMASLHEKHSAITAWCLFCSHFRVQKRKVQTKKVQRKKLELISLLEKHLALAAFSSELLVVFVLFRPSCLTLLPSYRRFLREQLERRSSLEDSVWDGLLQIFDWLRNCRFSKTQILKNCCRSWTIHFNLKFDWKSESGDNSFILRPYHVTIR